MTRKNLMGMVAVTIILLVGIDSANAYLVPASALMDRANTGRRRLSLRGLVMTGAHEKAGVRSQVWEAVRSDARRRELRRGDETNVVLTRGPQRFEFSPGSGPTRPFQAPLDLLQQIGFPTEPDEEGIRGISMLRRLGIDTNVVSLGRQNRRIVFVIGAKANEPNKPQLWLDKELLVPVRLVAYDRNRARVETRWLGFASPLTGPYFPRRIETWVNGELTESVTYSKIQINPRLDDTLFEPPT